MSWSFKTLALSMAMLWAIAPQIACFMPDEMTETEQECCKQMTHDCSGSGISHECCRTVVRPDVGTLASATRVVGPDTCIVTDAVAALPPASLHGFRTSVPASHAPPHDSGTFTVILRI
jgi:hypothetical protein